MLNELNSYLYMKENLRQILYRRRSKAAQYIQQANELSEQGNQAAADELYSKAVELAPSLIIQSLTIPDMDPNTPLRRTEKTIDDLERYLKDEAAKS